jgi:hypothetical protein
LNILHHAACFLGNDFIARSKGNTPKKLKEFVENVTDENFELKEDKIVFEYISANVLKMKKEEKLPHIKNGNTRWQCFHMVLLLL